MPLSINKTDHASPAEQSSAGVDVRRYCDCDMRQAEVHEFAGGRAAVFSSRCPGSETANEDAAAMIPFNGQSGILVVADGLGGGCSGERASNLVVESLVESSCEAFQCDDSTQLEGAAPDGVTSRTSILNGIEAANQELLRLGLGAATTLAVVEIQDRHVRPYHVGDSMIVVVGQRGKIKLQTVSHSPVGFAVEAGVLGEAEAMHHEDRHLVSNVVGSPEMRIEMGSPLKLAPRDTLLLASDGLFDNLHVEEVVERLRTGPLDRAVNRLAEDCRHRMLHPDGEHPSKPDDMAILAFRLN